MLEHLCSYLPVIFARIFVRICDFYIGNAVQFSIRSDPFFEVFLKDLSSKVDMYAYWTITYAYTIVLVSILCQNLEFSSRNAIRFLSVLSRSIRNKTRSYALLCKIVLCMPIFKGLLAILCPKVPKKKCPFFVISCNEFFNRSDPFAS